MQSSALLGRDHTRISGLENNGRHFMCHCDLCYCLGDTKIYVCAVAKFAFLPWHVDRWYTWGVSLACRCSHSVWKAILVYGRDWVAIGPPYLLEPPYVADHKTKPKNTQQTNKTKQNQTKRRLVQVEAMLGGGGRPGGG